MYKKTINYKDYGGTVRSEEFCFELSKEELLSFLVTDAGYTIDEYLNRLVKTSNRQEQINIIKDLVKKSYGVISLDKRRFIKNDEVWEEFHQTPAFSIFFMELISNDKAAAEFVNGILDEDLMNEIIEALASNPEGVPEELKALVNSKEPNIQVVDNNENPPIHNNKPAFIENPVTPTPVYKTAEQTRFVQQAMQVASQQPITPFTLPTI